MADYIQDQDAEELDILRDALEDFLQKAGAFSISRMTDLDETQLLLPTKTTSYKFYQNCYLEITQDKCIVKSYDDLEGKLVWANSILPRNFFLRENCDRGLFYQFCNNAIGFNEHLSQVLGYYAHEFKDETTGYIGIMTEQCINPEEGAAGKNVFANLLRLTTSLKSMPGCQTDWSDKILSSWNSGKGVFHFRCT